MSNAKFSEFSAKHLERVRAVANELLREILRKVVKTQDAGLSDYELRDLNGEIIKQMREKRDWDNQIVALGGANYLPPERRDAGKEVPGTKEYTNRCTPLPSISDSMTRVSANNFGGAKELSGVRELF
ncbi:Isy1-like splicing factor [Mycena galopus ATCC 62051]|nr:Isy1-like splicing factor [Mycena galopus ATCC 62051]